MLKRCKSDAIYLQKYCKKQGKGIENIRNRFGPRSPKFIDHFWYCRIYLLPGQERTRLFIFSSHFGTSGRSRQGVLVAQTLPQASV